MSDRATTSPRKWRLSGIRTVALLSIPSILYTASFASSVVAIRWNDWSHRVCYNPNQPHRRQKQGLEHRSPFVRCTLSTGGAGKLVETCIDSFSPGGLCSQDYDNQPDGKPNNDAFCQQIHISANLLWAGSALLAATLLITLVLNAVLISRQFRIQPLIPRTKVAFWTLSILRDLIPWTSVFGATTLGLGTVIASAALVVMQFPNGDWMTTGLGGDPVMGTYRGPWLLGPSPGLALASCVVTGISFRAVGAIWSKENLTAEETDGGEREPLLRAGDGE